ncbi:MAG: hypothetical protein KDB03_18720 [Planctomycetales bacterium]|nr:hypothetical protein [Planctomycetales bacterium]
MQDIDEQLSALVEQMYELSKRSHIRSAVRVAQEVRRLARAEERLTPYADALFRIMVDGPNLMEPNLGRDAAVELIGILESEERARSIQPDLSEVEYEHAVLWMSACAYDNLAKNTATISGYNSEGMQQCINDGIQVCRRTGKLQCVTCFREYATDVYAASDDLDMAMHFARLGIQNERRGPHDRRWVGARDLFNLQLLSGDLEGCQAIGEQLLELAPTYHTPADSAKHTFLLLERLCFVSGKDLTPESSPEFPPEKEHPLFDMFREQNRAVRELLDGEVDQAIRRLTSLEQNVQQRQCLVYFFDTRLKLMSALRFAGRDELIPRLATDVEQKARQACDWLTLRLSQLLASADAPLSPLPTLRSYGIGPFALVQKPASAPPEECSTSSLPIDDKSRESAEEERTQTGNEPPTEFIATVWQRLIPSLVLEPAARAENFLQLRDEVLEVRCTDTLEEARWLIHTMYFLLDEKIESESIWLWAQTVASQYAQDGICMSLLANLGAGLRYAHDADEQLIGDEELERLFRTSLALADDSSRTFERAGRFFQYHHQLGEAERCYARGFRLDRKSATLAQLLADIYNQTDRQPDALAVLDLCLREGCEDSQLAWQAAVSAFQLGQFTSALTYLEKYENTVQDDPWTGFYRIASQLELDQFEDAAQSLHEARVLREQMPGAWHILSASTAAGLKDIAAYTEELTTVLQIKLSGLAHVTPPILAQLFRRLWLNHCSIENQIPQSEALVKRMLETGLAPNEYFNHRRLQVAAAEGLSYFQITLRQSLPDEWAESTGCLWEQDDWKAYEITWGVLAESESEAIQSVNQQQGEFCIWPFEITDIQLIDENYRDNPGICWQGFRAGEVPPSVDQ